MTATKSAPALAVLICLPFSFGPSAALALETVSYFCKDCVSMETARQQALEYAVPVDCGNPTPILDPGSGSNCVVTDRLVVLGNHLNNQVYTFLVERQSNFPWTASATDISMTDVEVHAYQGVLELRRVWEAFVARGIDRPAFRARSMATKNAADCPENTALDAFFDNAYQSLILDQIEVSVSGELEQFANEMPLIRRLVSGVFLGLSRGGLTVGLRTPDLDEIQTEFFFNFDESEVQTTFGIPDRLVYEVVEVSGTIPTQNLGNIAVTSIELRRDQSRVAGRRLDRFLSGQTDITNECVLDKLSALDDSPSGEFQVGGVPLNADGSVGSGGGSGGPSGSSGSGMCVFDFFINGRYQYSFRAPCDGFETNDEIEP